MRLGIADEIVPEPLGGAHRDPAAVMAEVAVRVTAALDALSADDGETLAARRYERLRAIGVFSGGTA